MGEGRAETRLRPFPNMGVRMAGQGRTGCTLRGGVFVCASKTMGYITLPKILPRPDHNKDSRASRRPCTTLAGREIVTRPPPRAAFTCRRREPTLSGRHFFFPFPLLLNRLRAAKRSFTPSTSLRTVAKRRFIPRGGTSNEQKATAADAAAQTRAGAGAADGQEEPETAGNVTAEVYPTGLVVTKHFRESSTGREILMLEVDKVGSEDLGAAIEQSAVTHSDPCSILLCLLCCDATRGLLGTKPKTILYSTVYPSHFCRPWLDPRSHRYNAPLKRYFFSF